MLKLLLINLIIACIGFGSGTIFISLIYDAYTTYTSVSVQTLDVATSISMALPAPVSPKMLSLIAYQEYGFWFIWPAVFVFVIPTIFIVIYTFKHYNKFKDNSFFKDLSKYFPPIMGAITAYIVIVLSINNVSTMIEFKLFIVPLVVTLLIRYGFKIKNNGYYLIANIITLFLLSL
ncbi:chromate transporter [Mollicutes bacterium LVI A0039]|nr:chromate transporter [Mollicutes bacterium LVI A0039]